MKSVFLFTAIFIFCSTNIIGQPDSLSMIRFIQNDSVYRINTENSSIMLKKAPFSIRFFSKAYETESNRLYSAKIIVLQKEDSRISPGENIPAFAPGTGLAAYREGYESAEITNEGHHYLYYENENDKRVDLVSQKDDMLELDWKITAFSFEDKNFPVAALKQKALYFYIFIDRNLDEIIDEGELRAVKVLF
jgi:hypothetical protein